MKLPFRFPSLGFLLSGCLLILQPISIGAQTSSEHEVASTVPGAAVKRGYFGGKEDGWFWYKDPTEEAPKEAEPEKPVEIKQEETKPKKDETKEEAKELPPEAFSAEWLRRNMPVLMDRAIDDPTDENVSAYLYAQRIALDKAQNYAEKTRHVIANDPFLDENNRVPLATFAKKEFLNRTASGQTKALDFLATKAGIWLFYDSTCDFCHVQSRIIQSVAKKHRFHAMFISMNGEGLPNLAEHYVNQGQAEALGIQMTPTTVLVVPPNNYFIVSQGLMSEDQLSERLVVAADSNNLFPDEYKKEINLYRDGVLSPEDLSAGASDDPAIWLRLLKEKISGKQS